MLLILMRHGYAGADILDDPELDSQRSLTPEGRELVGRVAQGLRKLSVQPPKIICSPYVRTVETAEIVAKVLTPAQTPESYDWLTHEATIPPMAYALSEMPTNVFVVTHHDVQERFVSYLVDGNPATKTLALPPASCVMVDTEVDPIKAGHGHIEWAIQAEQIALLADTPAGSFFTGLKPLISEMPLRLED